MPFTAVEGGLGGHQQQALAYSLEDEVWRGLSWGAQSRGDRWSLTQARVPPPYSDLHSDGHSDAGYLSGLSRALELVDTQGPCLPIPTFCAVPDPWKIRALLIMPPMSHEPWTYLLWVKHPTFSPLAEHLL